MNLIHAGLVSIIALREKFRKWKNFFSWFEVVFNNFSKKRLPENSASHWILATFSFQTSQLERKCCFSVCTSFTKSLQNETVIAVRTSSIFPFSTWTSRNSLLTNAWARAADSSALTDFNSWAWMGIFAVFMIRGETPPLSLFNLFQHFVQILDPPPQL